MRSVKTGFSAIAFLLLSACSGPGYDTAAGTVANSLEKSVGIDWVNVYLSTGDCSDALSQILPLYNSSNTNNAIRFATAAAYGCSAKVNLLQNLDDLVSFDLVGTSGLFEFMVQEFPSTTTPDDKIPQAAELGTDALQSIIQSGTVIVAGDAVNSTSNNPGSVLYSDRMPDANSYLTFMSMSLMGSLQSRYGKPLPPPSNHKTVNLPWTSATLLQGDGCAYVSSIINFFDGLTFIQTAASANVAAIYAKFQALAPLLAAACNQGCSDCGLTIACNGQAGTCCGCPNTLRSRASCTGSTTDPNSCAAAGIVNYFVNPGWTTGPP